MNKKERKVPIKNILYMYSYVWDKVDFNGYKDISDLDDYNSSDILCTLFLINIQSILEKGLYREYNEINEELRGIKGKIDFKNSINNLSFENSKSYCTYDELNENNRINQIIKSTAMKLYNSSNTNKDYKKKLNNVLLYFNNVDIIEINKSSFDINFNRNNKYTYFLIKVCELINNCLAVAEDKGNYKFIDLLDDDKTMPEIYELFVYKFYKLKFEKERKKFKVEYQHNVNWNLRNGNQDMLPNMKLDITLSNAEHQIIIDTKYYRNYTTINYDKRTFISGNMYQMMSYMNNINSSKILNGILLYPLPYEGKPAYEVYDTSVTSNGTVKPAKFRIITIDLSQKWDRIEKDLMGIINRIVDENEII